MFKSGGQKIYKACEIFFKYASDGMDYDKIDSYGRYIASFFKISDTHPKYAEAEEKIKNMLKTSEGQEGLSAAFSLFAHGIENGKNVQRKLDTFLPLTHGEVKKELIGWLTPEFAKNYINDPDPEIQAIVSRTLGITPDREYENIWKSKEISDTLPIEEAKKPFIELPKIPKVPTKEDMVKFKSLLDEYNLQFGKQNTKLN